MRSLRRSTDAKTLRVFLTASARAELAHMRKNTYAVNVLSEQKDTVANMYNIDLPSVSQLCTS